MKQYIGTKIIHAEPAQKAGYDGYFVKYPDGYTSWSPKDVFEEAYRATDALTFGLALEAMKMGCKIARKGWNGTGMFVYYVPANSYPANTKAALSFYGYGANVPYNAYMALKTVDNRVSTWVPSVTDCLAEDWEIVQ